MDNGMPTLTLDPNAALGAPAAPSAPTAPAAPTLEAAAPTPMAAPAAPSFASAPAAPSAAAAFEPTLTFDAEADKKKQEEEAKDANAVQIGEDMLTEEEKAIVNDFASKIDISDSNMVMTYGAAAQQHIASFSESALSSVKTKGKPNRIRKRMAAA